MTIDKYAIMSALLCSLLQVMQVKVRLRNSPRIAQPLWEVVTNLMTQIELNQADFACL